MKLLAAPQTSRKKRVLAVLAVLTTGLLLFGPDDPAGTAAVVQSDAYASTTDTSGAAQTRRALEFPTRIAGDHEILQVFGGHSWYVAPPPVAIVQMAPPKPVAPPLPFAYLGRFVETGGKPVYYLVKGDRAYDVRVGETLDGTYTLDAEDNGRLLFTYLPLKERQSLGVGK
ncbi:MAG: hypothetical protein OEW16_05110 [Gammaproteobacteria bacterium]|nr:hypothetical protein [Gammaproteobacteria bacterium]